MKLGDLKVWKLGRSAIVRFPSDTGAKDGELVLMMGMWLLENFVDAYCEDKRDAINVIADRMRKHLMGGK